MDARKMKMLIVVLAAMLLLFGAGVAYAANSALDNTSTGDRGAQVAGEDDSDGPGEAEEPGDDADEPGDVDGPGDTED